MPVCRYYLSNSGCMRGDQCRFEHTNTTEETLLAQDLASASTSTTYDLEFRPRCRFYVLGACRNGEKCRFGHSLATTSKNETVAQAVGSRDLPNPRAPRPDAHTSRDLGGALVTFGPGAEVLDVKPAAAAATTELRSVSCSWRMPSKTASLAFKTMESLDGAAEKAPTFKLHLDDQVPLARQLPGYLRICEKLGKSAARLNITSSPRTLTIYGSSNDAEWAKAILLEVSGSTTQSELSTGDQATCAVCLCVASEKYTTPCGHRYDRDCFVGQCLAAGDLDFPIKCLGSSGKCQTIIPYYELETHLTRAELDTVLERSFKHYIRTHPQSYQYCPTAGCDQVYRVSEEGQVYTCTTCLTSICTSCGAVSHEGLTCEQFKGTMLQNESFMEWKKNNDTKDCPKCGCTIQKFGGCNHIQCGACRAELCWICLKIFPAWDDAYRHLVDVHDDDPLDYDEDPDPYSDESEEAPDPYGDEYQEEPDPYGEHPVPEAVLEDV